MCWAAKRAKMRLSPDVHCAVSDTSHKHNFDCRPEQLLTATKHCDKVVVFAIDADRIKKRVAVLEFVDEVLSGAWVDTKVTY